MRALLVGIDVVLVAGCGGSGRNDATTTGAATAAPTTSEIIGSVGPVTDLVPVPQVGDAEAKLAAAVELATAAQERCTNGGADAACIDQLLEAVDDVDAVSAQLVQTVTAVRPALDDTCANAIEALANAARDYDNALGAYAGAVTKDQRVVVTDQALTDAGSVLQVARDLLHAACPA